MKKYILFFIISYIYPFVFVSATEIYNIDMQIFIDNYGNATVTEVWDTDVTEGTEGYHPYYNLGSSVINNLEVTMDGRKFQTITNWDIDNSFSQKAYKAGIYETDEEVDICFGITSYGRHSYTIKYNISNFVAKTNDYDMVYWNLFPYNFSAEPSNVDITIYSNFKYSNIELYGYGNSHTTNSLSNGKIYINSNGRVDSSEYITILIKYPKDTFNNSYHLNNDFNYYLDMANEGAVNYNDNNYSDFIVIILELIFGFIPFILVTITIIIASLKNSKNRYGLTGNKVRKDIPNFRDIPCNKDVFRAYWVAYNYGLVKNKEDFLGSILLKWLNNGNVRIEKIEKNGLFKDKINNNVVFVNKPVNSNKYECDLYDWMYEASIDGKLEENEFKKWCSKNYKKILDWFDDVLNFQTNLLVNEGKASISVEKKFKLFKITYYDIDSSMMQEAEQLAGLKQFLKEFSLIKEKEPIEVKLWNEYLIFAQIFGIAKEVARQFKKLYPEITDDMNNMGYDYGDIVFIHSISSNGIKSANASSSSSSSSGGGGSFGGGGGGGGFR